MRIVALCSFFLLSGCALFEAIFEGLARFIEENEDGPAFAYVTVPEPTVVRFAVIAEDDTGFVLQSVELDEFQAFADSISLSVENTFALVNYSIFSRDISDFGFYVVHGNSGTIEHKETDNTVSLEPDLACMLPMLEDLAGAAVRRFARVVFPDTFEDSMSVEVTVTKRSEDGGNVIFAGGWTGRTQFTARAEFFYDVDFEIPALSYVDRLPEGYLTQPISSDLIYNRRFGGTWEATACPTSLPALLPPRAPTRLVTLDGREVHLDGAELQAALGGGPMERRQVLAVDGAY